VKERKSDRALKTELKSKVQNEKRKYIYVCVYITYIYIYLQPN